jgi:hypothetical protein
MNVFPGRVKVDIDEADTGASKITFKPREEMKNESGKATTITIPEFLVGETYPYFYHTWNKLLLCSLNDVSKTFHINDKNAGDPNIYINNLTDGHDNFNNFEQQHKNYGNSLQNYYTIVNQSGILDANWKELERINITTITPLFLQKCENIMSTLLFMPLDQCHDFRGGRTSGTPSWVTETPKGLLQKDVDNSITTGISENLYSNEFMNTLVKTSFSGKKNIVGIMVISDESLQLLLSEQSGYKHDENNINIQTIMDNFGQFITIDSNINMNCDPRGNKLRLQINGNDAQIIFLGFTSDGWDKGMHDVWSMNEKKHIYSIRISSIKQLPSGQPEVIYSGEKITVFENVVPCYEMLYKSKGEGDPNAFINNFQLSDGTKITKSNFNDFFQKDNFDKLYNDFLAELYRTGKHIDVEEEEIVEGGAKIIKGGAGEIDKSGVVRGATYKFYGVRAPDSKTSERMSSENRVRHLIFENIFIEILKKISKSISPQIHPDFKYPEITEIVCEGETEQLNDRISKINELYEKVKQDYKELYPKIYDENLYKETLSRAIEGYDEDIVPEEDKFIIKQFGTVNDMNIAPVIEKVMDSLNCSDNCNVVNVERIEAEEIEEIEDLNDNTTTESLSSALTASGDPIKKPKESKTEKKAIKSCQTDIEMNIQQDLNNKYPFKFQVVSGVLDSSLQGGENMPQYFPPELDIFMTIFDNNGNLQGAIVRMTFLKVILKNTTNTKNNARVFSHFTYVEFDEINMECPDKLGADWKNNAEQYPFALKQLLNYVVNNTFFLPRLTNDLISNFELKLKEPESFKRWFFYFTDTAGPSVSEGINDIVKKIFTEQIGIISDDNVDVSESIVKVAQKIYINSPKLREIFTAQTGKERSFAFESIFLLKIKYIGDKSRCTDSLFLNVNKYAECMQITGDENAYFTALINGASTIYSPPSRFAFYFAPYFTYGDVVNEGKFLANLPIYKETLLKGESPSMFKINSASSKKKSINTDSVIPFESSLITKGPFKSGIEVREISNKIIKDIENGLALSYFSAQLRINNFNDANALEDVTKRNKQLKDTKKDIEGYVTDYEEIEKLYKTLEKYNLQFIKDIDSNKNRISEPYYSKIIEQLNEVLIDNEFIAEPVVLSTDDFKFVKQEMITFFEKAIDSMKKMVVTPYSKDNPPKMLDIDGVNVKDKKLVDVVLPVNAYDDINKYMPIYQSILNSLKQTEDVEEFKNVLTEINDTSKQISTLKGASEKVVFWNEMINYNINFIFVLTDITNHILPNIKTAKTKFASQTNKYAKAKPNINEILSQLKETLAKKKTTPSSVPLSSTTELSIPSKRQVVSEPIMSITKEKTEETKFVAPLPGSEAVTKATRVTREKIGGQKPDEHEESYRKNQIHILKCFVELIKSNDELHTNLLSTDKQNLNYNSIDSLDKYCISILMLQTYYSFQSFQPKMSSLHDITNEIDSLNEDTSKLTDAINIRNYYSQIINNFIDIEYLQPDASDYIMNLYNVEIVVGDNLVYDMDKWCNTNYYVLTFLYENLNLINAGQSKFINNIHSNNFSIITKLYDMLQNVDLKIMDSYYELSKIQKDIDSADFITPEEKTMFKEQIETVDKYEYLSLFFIKYCNELALSFSGNRLKYSSDNGILYNYSTITDKLGEEGLTDLIDKFNSIKINIGLNEPILQKLAEINQFNSLKESFGDINNIIDGLFGKTDFILKNMEKGVNLNVRNNRMMSQPITRMYEPINYREIASQAAGTLKNKRRNIYKKTKNAKKNNKMTTKKRIHNRQKKNTRKN